MKRNFGFIHDKLEIKILVLFIMRRLPGPVMFSKLTDLTMCDDGINYFDCAECIAELVETGHLRVKDGEYSITGKGARNGEIAENGIPMSVRMKADRGAYAFRAAKSRDAEIKAKHTIDSDGSVTVNLALSDGIGNILSIDMYAANEQQARALERGFRKNAEKIYNDMIDMLLD